MKKIIRFLNSNEEEFTYTIDEKLSDEEYIYFTQFQDERFNVEEMIIEECNVEDDEEWVYKEEISDFQIFEE